MSSGNHLRNPAKIARLHIVLKPFFYLKGGEGFGPQASKYLGPD